MINNTFTMPDYSRWLLSDLLQETTRLALAIERAEGLNDVVQVHWLTERHHMAMASLVALAEPFDKSAAARAEATRHHHLQQAHEARALRLGLKEHV